MKSLAGNKIPIIDLIFILCLVIYGGNASIFTREYGNINTLSTLIPLGLAFIVGFKHKVRLDSTFVISVSIFFVYWLFASVINGYFSFGIISRWFVNLFICYVCCKCYGLKYLDYFETIVFYLTIVAMIFWASYLIAPDRVMSFCQSIRWGESFSDHTEVVNIGIYTLLDENFEDEFHLFYRNSGFAWEPGAFAVFLCFAIACNIIRKGGIVLKHNLPLLLFLVALFSTESTTGGGSLILILVFWLSSNRFGWKSIIFLLLLIPFVIWIISLDFVGSKFSYELEEAMLVQSGQQASQETGGTPRLISFLLYLQEFMKEPIFGNAGNPNTYLKSIGFETSLHSGIGKLLAEYGIIMSSIFLWLCFKSNQYVFSVSGKHYGVILAALFGSMVSFQMWESPIFFTFIILGIFISQEYVNHSEIS